MGWPLCVPGTPLALARQRFTKQLLQENPKPIACERGAARALRLHKLKEFYNFFNPFIQDRSMYYVCSNLVVPLTRAYKLSYAELAGPTEVVWFVSHYWGMPLRHFIEAISSHSQSRAAAAILPSYWVCTFSNNQWEVEEELGKGDWQDSSFFKALRSACWFLYPGTPEKSKNRLPKCSRLTWDRQNVPTFYIPGIFRCCKLFRSHTCKGTLMIIDEQALPFHRAWCLFEVLQTVLRCQEDQDFTGFSLGTSSGVLNEGAVKKRRLSFVLQKLPT